MEKIEIRIANTSEIVLLRRKVLWPHKNLGECTMDSDSKPSTFHVAAFHGEVCVGTSTWQRETSSKWSKLNVFRLRAMAVDMDFRRFKIGLKMIEMGREEVVHAGGEGIWCDARVSALQFYRAAGFSELEEEYFITNIGWHRFMFLTCN